MAQRTPRPQGGRGQPPRAVAKSKKPAAAEVESAEEPTGIGFEAGLAIMTSIVLLAALVLVDMMQAKNGDGLIF